MKFQFNLFAFFLSALAWCQMAFAVPPTDPEGRIMRASLAMKELAATPATPSAGFMKIYPKTDGKLYMLNSAGVEKAVGTGAGGAPNYILNPSADSNATDGILCSNANLSRDANAANSVDGIASYLFQSLAQGGFCQFSTVAIPLGDRTGNCGFSASYMGDAGGIHRLQAFADLNDLITQSEKLPASVPGKYAHIQEIVAPCGEVRTVRITQTEAGTGQPLNIGRVNWSRATGIGSVAQAELRIRGRRTTSAQTITSVNPTQIIWNSAQLDSGGELNTSTGAITVKKPGRASIKGSVLFSNITVDETYEVRVRLNGADICGGTIRGLGVAAGEAHISGCAFDVVANDQITFVADSVADTSYDVFAANNTNFTYELYPTQSEISVRPADLSWYVDAMFGGGNPSLGTSTVGSYAEITDASTTLTPNPGSAPVGILCSATNAAAAPSSSTTTCSAGNESLGFRVDIPRAGTYELCSEIPIYTSTASTAVHSLELRWSETPTNAQTDIQQSWNSHYYRAGSTNGSSPSEFVLTHNYCTRISFSSAGEKALRLKYTQSATGTLNSASIQTNGAGGRRFSFTMKPWLAATPAPFLVGSVTSKSSGLQQIESARATKSGSCTTDGKSSDWYTLTSGGTGQCVFTFNAGNFGGGIPDCTCTSRDSGVGCRVGITSNTLTTVTFTTSTGAAVDGSVSVMCLGTK